MLYERENKDVLLLYPIWRINGDGKTNYVPLILKLVEY